MFVMLAFVVLAAGSIGAWRIARRPSSSDVRQPDVKMGSDPFSNVRQPDQKKGSDPISNVRQPDQEKGSDPISDVRPDNGSGAISKTGSGTSKTGSGATSKTGSATSKTGSATSKTGSGTSTSPVETGWLQVTGPDPGSEVIVDGGKWKWTVPEKHDIPVGDHRVEVLLRDGTKLPAKTAKVTGFDSPSKPQKLRFP
jgi:hypothetical protein